MSEMVERVALAIAASDDIARLAIKAMREPTEDMQSAGYNAGHASYREEARMVWQAMIDEALK